MRDSANLAAYLFYHRGVLRNGAYPRRVELMRLVHYHPEVHAKRCQQLADTIVQFTRDLPSLLIPHLLQPAGKLAEIFICQVQVRGSFLDFPLESIMRFSQLLFRPLAPGQRATVRFSEGDDQRGKDQESEHSRNCSPRFVECKGVRRRQKPIPDAK